MWPANEICQYLEDPKYKLLNNLGHASKLRTDSYQDQELSIHF